MVMDGRRIYTGSVFSCLAGPSSVRFFSIDMTPLQDDSPISAVEESKKYRYICNINR